LDDLVTESPSLLSRIADATRRHPERAGLVLDDDVLTHHDVDRLSSAVARGLAGAGLGRGSRVAVLGPNHLLTMVATLGIVRSGATWIPLNPRDSIDAIAGLCRRFRTDLLIHHSDFTDALAQIRGEAPTLTATIALDDGPRGAAPTLLEWASAHDVGAALGEPADDDLIAVFATGGTTGVSKGVCYSYRTLSAIAGNFVDLLADAEGADRGDPVFLAAAPLTHVSGRVCLGVMAAGGTTVVLPQFEPSAVLAAIESHRVTTMVLPTTLLNRLLAHPAAGSTDTSSLRRVAVGASPVPVELLKRAIRTFGPVVAQNYGQTEAPMHISAMRPDEYLVDGEFVPDVRMASCGRATRFCEIRTVTDDGTDVAPGEVGEIVVRGNFVMDRYLDDDAATSATRIDGWHRTGDLGTLDPQGYLTIVGRLKDMIITGGFNVYPAEIEGVIAERPEVHESAVIGLPDADWGERIVAVVEPASDAVVDTDDLLRHIRGRLGAVKTPKDVMIVDALPRNANGKVLKRLLVEQLGQIGRLGRGR
jgi:acyl-CoA synthetase (AMP-forming)/AMP-acid ligase II